jgi:hypothetical protein
MADPLASLVADVPIVLLPVRVETRWFPVGNPTADPLELRIRIYPDEIHIAAPPTVTLVECADTAAYHDAKDDAAKQSRHALLVERYGASRAAWLVRALAPGAPRVADADAAPQTRVAAMPDHWVAILKGPSFRLENHGKPIAADLAAAPHESDKHDDPNTPALGNTLRWISDFDTAEKAGMAMRISVPRADAERLEELIVVGVATQDPEAAAGALGALVAQHASSSVASLLPWGTPTNSTTARTAPRALAALGEAPAGDAARAVTALGIAPAHARDVVADAIDRHTITRAMHVAMWPATWGYYLPQLAGQTNEATARARALFVEHVRPAGPLPALRVGAQPYGLLPATSLAQWPVAAERGGLAAFLVKAEQLLQPITLRVPRLVGSDDVDRDLVTLLRRLPASRGAWVRQVTDSTTAAASLGGDIFAWIKRMQEQMARIGRALLAQQLGLPETTRALDLVYGDAPARLGIPFVAPAGTPLDAPLPKDYLSGIAAASPADLEANRVDGADPRTLLYLLARYAAAHAHVPPPDAVVHDGGIVARVALGRVWTRFGVGTTHVFSASIAEHQQALRALGTAPVGELEHALAGVIDSASYRIDAWATAIASERLAALRTAKPRASHVGGWAWLEAPRPSPRPSDRGFLHAPSMAQARTAAVLRAGYEAHRTDGAGQTLAVDISSDRVRAARWLLDGMREGRPLGRLLGDRVESFLAPKHPELISSLRGTSDLADGWALYHAWSKNEPSGPLGDAYHELRELLDAVADLLLAESVHAAVTGSPARTGAALDALERGEVATPDPRVDRTDTDGRRTERRVVLLLGEAPGWPGATRPRARAAPELEGLAARVLGKPERVTIDIVVERDGTAKTVQRTLADLKLCALDAVLLAADGEQAILAAAMATEPDARRATGGPALDELVLRGAALARLLRAARTPRTGELGAITVREARAHASDDIGLATLATPAPIASASVPAGDARTKAELAAWLADMARVRPALEPLDLLTLIAPEIFVASRVAPAKYIEHIVYATAPHPTAALVVDGWSEAPPAKEIMTGAAFPFDAPRGQPPQAVLLAVPPPAVPWSLPLLEAIVDETIARARLRVSAPEDARGQLAPTILVTDDRAELVPAIDFTLHAFLVEEVLR